MSITYSYQLSTKLLKEQGYIYDRLERWIPEAHLRKDFMGLADVGAAREDMNGMTFIQCCGEDVQNHIVKIIEGYTDKNGKFWPPLTDRLKVLLKAGNRFFIWSWCLRGAKGKRKTYRLREIEFLIENGQVVHREIPHEDNNN